MKNMYQLIARWGGYVVYRINGKIIAGTLVFIYGEQMYLSVIAHDDDYGKYNVGNLVLLKTIEWAIQSNIEVFHFLWGRCDYKVRFKSEQRNMYNVEIYKVFLSYFYCWTYNEIIKMCEKIKEKVKPFLLPIYKKLKGIR